MIQGVWYDMSFGVMMVWLPGYDMDRASASMNIPECHVVSHVDMASRVQHG